MVESSLEVGHGVDEPMFIPGYMVNHGLTVRPQPLCLMAPERRAVHCYYVAHRSVWLIIGSADVI